MQFSRRTLLTAASAGVGLLALGGGVEIALNTRSANDRDILIAVFLRFGSDGLTMIAPADDGAYRDNRPTIAVTTSGPQAGLPIGTLDRVPFFMHPSLAALKPLYDAKQLAVVHAVGLPTNTRSHFESQDMMERGSVEGGGPLRGGWLARHLVARDLALPNLGVVASAADVPASLRGYAGAVAVPDATQFNVTGGNFNLDVIDILNTGAESHAGAARATVEMIRSIQASLAKLSGSYTTSANYPEGEFAVAMRSVANLIKMGSGLEVAAVDFGGWDHHYQMNTHFPGHAAQLAKTLAAFWSDMRDYQDRLTIVTMTEFGRRLEENTAGGTDHGAASFMFALGGAVKGGKIYGQWPGLKPADLREGDLRITTDMRQVLQEILMKRRGEDALAHVFPQLPYAPLDILNTRT
jgi:uncharacterized protein (DUF1501 family)